MKDKLSFWIISDDADNKIITDYINYLQDKETIVNVINKLSYDIVGQHLCNCERLSGSADVIIMDLSSLSLGLNVDGHYTALRHFLRKHSASIFHLVCYVYKDAIDTIEEIKEICKEEDVVFTAGLNGNDTIAEYMFNKTMEFYAI